MKKKLLWLLATLVLGALGSGLWELAFRPILAFCATTALDIVTLGMESLRNGLYKEAARGQYERVSITMLSAGAGMMIGASIMTLLAPDLRRRLNVMQGGNAAASLKFSLKLLFVFVTTLAILLFQRTAYINRAVNHFEQLAQIVAPYQTEQERLLVRSKFAQMISRDQYEQLIRSLVEFARSRGITSAPQFSIY